MIFSHRHLGLWGVLCVTAACTQGSTPTDGTALSPTQAGAQVFLVTPLGEASPSCPTGGQEIAWGTDDGLPAGIAGDGLLQPGEIEHTQTVCNGMHGPNGTPNDVALIEAEWVGPGVGGCQAGGLAIRVGFDNGRGGGVASNGRLEPGEVLSQRTACNGDVGSIGQDAPLVRIQPAAAQACPNGGLVFSTGADDGQPAGIAGDGVLQPEEVEQSETLCSGANAPLTLFESEPLAPGSPACPAGGTRFSLGADDGLPAGIAGDGVLQSEEIDAQFQVCTGLDRGQVALGPDAPSGASGAAKLDVTGASAGQILIEDSATHPDAWIRIHKTGTAAPTLPPAPPASGLLGRHPLWLDDDVDVVNVVDHTDLSSIVTPAVLYMAATGELIDHTDDGDHVITGIYIPSGLTLTFDLDTLPAGTPLTPHLSGDVVLEGTLQLAGDPPAPAFAWTAASLQLSGRIEAQSQEPLALTLRTTGWAGTGLGFSVFDATLDLPEGSSLQIHSATPIWWTRANTLVGGQVTIETPAALYLSGDINLDGGTHTRGGRFEAYVHSLHANATLSARGGSDAEGCSGCLNAGSLSVFVQASSEIAGVLRADGTNPHTFGTPTDTAEPGGQGGFIDIVGHMTGEAAPFSGQAVAGSTLRISASLSARSGTRAMAGTLSIRRTGALSGDLALYGYALLTATSAPVTYPSDEGAPGGLIAITREANPPPHPFRALVYTGGIVNDVDVQAHGADNPGGTAGRAGQVTYTQRAPFAGAWPQTLVRGASTLRDGNGADLPIDTPFEPVFSITGACDATLSANVITTGASLTDPLADPQAYTRAITLDIDGALTLSPGVTLRTPGVNTSRLGVAGTGGLIALRARQVIANSAILASPGGLSVSDTGGHGGSIVIESFEGVSSVQSLSTDVSAGAGSNPGKAGQVFIDGVRR